MLAFAARRVCMHRHASPDGYPVRHLGTNFHDLPRRLDSEHKRKFEMLGEEQLANGLPAIKARSQLYVVAIDPRRMIAHEDLILADDRVRNLLDFEYLRSTEFMNYDCAHYSTSADSIIHSSRLRVTVAAPFRAATTEPRGKVKNI